MPVEKHYPAKYDKITDFNKWVPPDLILAYITIKLHDSEKNDIKDNEYK